MKKFIAPQMRVISYETSHICEGSGDKTVDKGQREGDGFVPSEGEDYEYAPSRRIFN